MYLKVKNCTGVGRVITISNEQTTRTGAQHVLVVVVVVVVLLFGAVSDKLSSSLKRGLQ